MRIVRVLKVGIALKIYAIRDYMQSDKNKKYYFHFVLPSRNEFLQMTNRYLRVSYSCGIIPQSKGVASAKPLKPRPFGPLQRLSSTPAPDQLFGQQQQRGIPSVVASTPPATHPPRPT
jgi:hypothetical protein